MKLFIKKYVWYAIVLSGMPLSAVMLEAKSNT
jgi:hypothetical protein